MKTEFKKLAACCLLAAMSLSGYVFGGDACSSNSCETNVNDCCDPCSGMYALYEHVIVKPYFSRNNAYFLEDPPGHNGQEGKQFDWGYRYTPRLEVGCMKECGLGYRARYWRFNDSSYKHVTDSNDDIASWFGEDSLSDIGFSGTGEAQFKHSMKLSVVDFEGMVEDCRWVYSAGIRYTRMDQRYSGEDLEPNGSRLKAKHNFEGWGLTAASHYKYPWCWGLSLFTKARGSLLYGHSGFKAWDPDGTDEIRNSTDRDLLAVGELQLGVDWRKTFCNICSYFTFAIETQYWVGGGAGGPGCNAVYDEGNYQNTHPQDSNLGFLGFTIGTGVLF